MLAATLTTALTLLLTGSLDAEVAALSPREKAQLVQISREKGVPVAEIVRTALPVHDRGQEAA